MSPRIAGTLAAPMVVLLVLLIPMADGFTDDGYIHIQYARNIVEHGEYSFNPGEVSFGTTSPLWVMVQAALATAVGTGENLIVTSRVVSWLCGFLAVAGIFFLARALGLGVLASVCSAMALASHTWFARWTALSMETSAAVLAVVAVGIASVKALESRRHALALGFAMAVAALVRPEAYLLFPVYLAVVVLGRRRTDPRCVVWTGVVYGSLLAPWLAFARYHIGSFLPNTAGAKSGGLILDPLTFIKKFEPIVKIVGSAEGLLVAAVLAAIVLAPRKTRIFSRSHRFLLLWVVALPVAYVVFDIQVLSRYMLLTSPFTIVLGFSALEEWAGRFSTDWIRRAVPAAVATVVVVINVAFYFTVVVPPSKAFSADLTNNLKGLGVYLNENASEDAVVAAADIGYLAFYSKRWVLDLGGLVDNETLALRERFTYEEIVERGLYLDLPKYPRVDYFIDRELTAGRFDNKTLGGYRFERVRLTEVRNLGIRKPGPYYYTLYRLTPVDND